MSCISDSVEQDSGRNGQTSGPISLTSSQSLDSSVVLDRSPSWIFNEMGQPVNTQGIWSLHREIRDMPTGPYHQKDEPVSLEVRARVREKLITEQHLCAMKAYRRNRGSGWLYGFSIEGSSVELPLPCVFNTLTSLYWMPSAAEEGRMLLSQYPFGCIFKKWFDYHDNKPYIHYGNFFANLLRIRPSGPTKVQEVVKLHKLICNRAELLRERIKRGEWIEELHWRPEPQNFHIRPTHRAIFMMLDQHFRPVDSVMIRYPTAKSGREIRVVNLEEHSKKQTVLLVRTGDDSHLKSPVSFEVLRSKGLCLPLDRTDVVADSHDVVRVSLANAVSFISDLERREDSYPELPRVLLESKRFVNDLVDQFLKETDEKGIDIGRINFTQPELDSYEAFVWRCGINSTQ